VSANRREGRESSQLQCPRGKYGTDVPRSKVVSPRYTCRPRCVVYKQSCACPHGLFNLIRSTITLSRCDLTICEFGVPQRLASANYTGPIRKGSIIQDIYYRDGLYRTNLTGTDYTGQILQGLFIQDKYYREVLYRTNPTGTDYTGQILQGLIIQDKYYREELYRTNPTGTDYTGHILQGHIIHGYIIKDILKVLSLNNIGPIRIDEY
jgi:hypothetical protein